MDEARNSFAKKSKATAEQREARADNALRKLVGAPQKFRSLTNPDVAVEDRPPRPRGFDDN